MMTDDERLKQLERLQKVPPQVWRKVWESLIRRMTVRLKAFVVCDERGVPRLVGGKTQHGAHSESVLKGNAYDVYLQETFDGLYFTWSWPEDRTLEEQALIVLDSVISKSVDRYRRNPEPLPSDMDVDLLGEEDEPTDEQEESAPWYDKAVDAVGDDPELLRLLDSIQRFDTTRERCAWLGINGRQYENLRKKVNRRLIKIIQK